MTTWQIAETWLLITACILAWTWGGRPERFIAGVLVVYEFVSVHLTFHYWHVDYLYPVTTATVGGMLVVFGWLALRERRWWLLVLTAIQAIVLGTYGLKLADPAISHFAAASARVGLFFLIDLALLVGVLERWLAGEKAAGPAAWAKAAGLTAARRRTETVERALP